MKNKKRKKIVSDYCLRCGKERKSREKSFGCYVYGDLMAKRHLYTYYDDEKKGVIV